MKRIRILNPEADAKGKLSTFKSTSEKPDSTKAKNPPPPEMMTSVTYQLSSFPF